MSADRNPKRTNPPHRTTAILGGRTDLTQSMEHSWRESPRAVDEDAQPDCLAVTSRYCLKREIARGGMGVILLCHDTLVKRDVAVKVLLSQHRHDEALHQRFVREARVVGQLQHPGIIPVYDMGETDDKRPFFAMQLIRGVSLAEVLCNQEAPQVDKGRQLSVLAQVCHALAYAHERGVVHLDLKPSNIMLGPFGAVQLMDWGLSRVIAGSDVDLHLHSEDFVRKNRSPLQELILQQKRQVTTSDESVQGTPAYMSPEQARGQPLDVRADVFGIGAILCEILTGRPPYSGDLLREVYSQAAQASLEEAWDGLDTSSAERPMVRLAKACLSPDREHRPRNAGEVADFLDAYVATALQTAESDLRRFFDLSLDLFCIANTSGYFLRINDNFSKVLGYSKEELVARPFLDFVHPDDKQSTIDAMSALSEGQPVIRFRNRYRTAGDSYLVLEWTSKSVPDEQVIYAVARDVTDDAD